MTEETDQLARQIESLEEKCDLLIWAIMNEVKFTREKDDYGSYYEAVTKDGTSTFNFRKDGFDVIRDLRGY